MKISLSFLVLFFLSVSWAYPRNSSSDFDKLYDSIYHNFHDQFFQNSDFIFSNSDRQEVQKLYHLNDADHSPVNRARIQYLDALIHLSDTLPNYKRVVSLVDEALTILTKEEYPKDYAKLSILKAASYVESRMEYVKAYHDLQESLSLLNKDDDPAFVGLAYNYFARLWIYLGEPESALEYIAKAEEIYREAGLEEAAAIIRINSYNSRLRMGQQIIPLIQKDLSAAEARKDTATAIFLNMIIGNSYVSKGSFDEAYSYLNKALNFVTEYSSPISSRKCDILYSLGILFYRKKDYKQAEQFFKETLPCARQLNLLHYESSIYQMLSEIENSRNNGAAAYDYLKKSVQLRDSLSIQEKAGELQRIQSHTELMNYQQQMQIVEQKSQLKQIRSLLIIAVLALGLLIIGFALFYINRKKKLRDLQIQQLDQQLKNKEMNNKLEKLELERRVEAKEREVAMAQLLMTEKGAVLEKMLHALTPFYSAGEIPEKIWREMRTFASSNSRKEDEWEKSKIHFEKVHPGFFRKLKEQFPDLTENELRLCAYIRIGMRSKQIGEMLSIDHKSVISNRYHLKKKMNLEKEQSLDDFVRNL